MISGKGGPATVSWGRPANEVRQKYMKFVGGANSIWALEVGSGLLTREGACYVALRSYNRWLKAQVRIYEARDSWKDASPIKGVCLPSATGSFLESLVDRSRSCLPT